MRASARALETRPLPLTRHPRPPALARRKPHEVRSDAAPLDMPTVDERITPSRALMAFVWSGNESHSARPARKTSLFGKSALEADRDEKARSVVALSRVPRLARFAGSPPAAGPFAAVNRPLVRIPANRHATTGTCEFGQIESKRFAAHYKSFFREMAGPTSANG
jgi:hypothetical protein